jgi:hypothetical protein
MVGPADLAPHALQLQQRIGLQRIQVVADGHGRDVGRFGKLIHRCLVALPDGPQNDVAGRFLMVVRSRFHDTIPYRCCGYPLGGVVGDRTRPGLESAATLARFYHDPWFLSICAIIIINIIIIDANTCLWYTGLVIMLDIHACLQPPAAGHLGSKRRM